jgi:hypothetical protein
MAIQPLIRCATGDDLPCYPLPPALQCAEAIARASQSPAKTSDRLAGHGAIAMGQEGANHDGSGSRIEDETINALTSYYICSMLLSSG